MTGKAGIVYLIGAGPGDPGLLTLKGAKAISEADVLVYDRLAHPRILEHARPDAELIYAGKTPDRHTFTQDEINALLVELAKQGKTVARVKGGDPFVFGRGGEEAEALVDAGLSFEIIPGITSAIAVPAYAGIPVTHREHTSALGIVTGHEDPTKEGSSLRWEHLAKGLDTLVFLMGVGNLPEIVRRLMDNGRSPQTPAAVIEWGTRPNQRTVTGTLETIVERINSEGIGSPAVTVVGDVVGLRDKLRWFDVRPLYGKRILVTRTREQASELTVGLEALGAETLEFPAIKCLPPESWDDVDAAISNLNEYDWIVFTSVNGVDYFLNRLLELGRDVRALVGLKIGALGEATRRAIISRSLNVDFMPTRFVAETFVEQFPDKQPGLRVLIPRAAEAREVIPEQLAKLGLEVDVLPCYRTVSGDEDSGGIRLMLASGQVDCITFTSSSTVNNFLALAFPEGDISLPDTVKIASIGPITSRTIAENGLPIHAEATEHTIPGLIEAVKEMFSA